MNTPMDDQYRAPRAGYQGNGHVIYEDIKVFSFSQRLNRLRYACYSFTSSLILALIMALVLILAMGLSGGDDKTIGVIAAVVALIFVVIWFLYYISLLVRRLHDMGKSGALALLILSPFLSVPLVMFDPTATTLLFLVNIAAPLFNLYLLAGAGDGMNRYGTPNEPNSVLVNFFGGICWVISVLVLLLNLTVLCFQYAAPDQFIELMKHLPLDPQALEQGMRNFQ